MGMVPFPSVGRRGRCRIGWRRCWRWTREKPRARRRVRTAASAAAVGWAMTSREWGGCWRSGCSLDAGTSSMRSISRSRSKRQLGSWTAKSFERKICPDGLRNSRAEIQGSLNRLGFKLRHPMWLTRLQPSAVRYWSTISGDAFRGLRGWCRGGAGLVRRRG